MYDDADHDEMKVYYGTTTTYPSLSFKDMISLKNSFPPSFKKNKSRGRTFPCCVSLKFHNINISTHSIE